MLGRDTEWRQGSILADDDALKLGLVEISESRKPVVVISHDCDLPNEAEATVEVILGFIVPKTDPMIAKARNPRRLHLTYRSSTGEEITIELRHADRRVIPKEIFAQAQRPDETLLLAADEKRALKQWLAARYGRPAFPSAFENRLRKQIKKRTIEQQIARILEPASGDLVGLFFDLGEERATELPEETPYFLSITVVYDAINGGQAARVAAENVAAELSSMFYEVFGTPDKSKELALEKCEAVADTYLTLADLRRVDQWRLEYISLRGDLPSDFLAVGELPA